MAKIQRALISVTDKSGIVPFARSLYDLSVELVSTGGTAKLIREAGIPVRDVADLTGFPEMLDGRVKTIHPAVAGGVLAVRGNAEHMASIREHNIGLIDMVVVNLYQFEKIAASAEATVPDLIENIDIGGPTMIRAAAKNFQDVAVVTSPDDYAGLISDLRQGNGNLPISRLWELAKKAFANTAAYDRAITARLASIQFIDDDGWQDRPAELPPVLDLRLEQSLPLRYGENPHQRAALYSSGKGGIANGAQLHGKELSYNNLVDLDAAWQLIGEFDRPAAAIIKHTNPCGCSEQDGLADAYRSAFEADPVSAFGGVLAFNRVVDAETAGEISKTFIEAIAAPGFSEGALDLLRTKKNLRLLEVAARPAELAVKSISGGLLAQTPDTHRLERWESKVVSERQPTDAEWAGLGFAWKVCKHVKSNAIVYASAGQLVSAGAGQMSRVDAVKVGAMKAVLPLAGTVLASDAFFPFPDGLEQAAGYGVTAVIQPGGSVRDDEVIAAANRLGIAMAFTGVRHFRH